MSHTNMGHDESQIGYLANCINLYVWMVDTPLACVDTTMVERKLVCRVSYLRDELIDRKGSHKKSGVRLIA